MATLSPELIQQAQERAKQWLAPDFDSETRQQVEALLAAEDKTPLVEAFHQVLEFGTGGLRGIMGAGTNRMNKYTVGMATQGLANYLLQCFAGEEISVAIGYDGRNNSPFFAQTTADVLTANGIKVYLYDALRPTPMVSYAIRQLGCKSGVMVTASHNPKEYNGYKVFWSDGAQIIAPHDKAIVNEVKSITDIDQVKWQGNPSLVEMIGAEMDDRFIHDVCGLSLSPESVERHRDMGIVYTPIHGTGVRIVPRTLEAFGFKNIIHVPEQDVIDGNFPTVVSPNPEEPAAMKLAIERAEATGADLVLASDPDGDRIGVAVRNEQGEMHLINGNQICALLTYYTIARRKELGDLRPDDFVVKTIVTTELIPAIAKDYGVDYMDCYTGFKWIANEIREQEGKRRYIGGGEESYGYLWETFVRDKSSVSACAIFAELTAWALDKGLTIDMLLEKIYYEHGYFLEQGVSVVRKGIKGAQEISQMMVDYRSNPMKELAGSPVVKILDYQSLEGKCLKSGETFPIKMPATSNVLQYHTADGTVLSIRPSGTEPKIKYYIGVTYKRGSDPACDHPEQLLRDRIKAIREQLSI